MSANALLNAIRAQAQMSVGEKTAHRVGQITAYDPNKYAVKVKMWPDTQESLGWIPLASTYIGNGWGLVAAPSIGDQVIIAFDREDQDAGVVIGRFFTDAEQPPAAPSGEFWLVHKSGSFLKFHNDGTVEITANSTMKYTATQHHFIGPVQMDNTLNTTQAITSQADIQDNTNTNAHTMSQMRQIYNTHTHHIANVQGGGSTVVSNAPDQTE